MIFDMPSKGHRFEVES